MKPISRVTTMAMESAWRMAASFRILKQYSRSLEYDVIIVTNFNFLAQHPAH